MLFTVSTMLFIFLHGSLATNKNASGEYTVASNTHTKWDVRNDNEFQRLELMRYMQWHRNIHAIRNDCCDFKCRKLPFILYFEVKKEFLNAPSIRAHIHSQRAHNKSEINSMETLYCVHKWTLIFVFVQFYQMKSQVTWIAENTRCWFWFFC